MLRSALLISLLLVGGCTAESNMKSLPTAAGLTNINPAYKEVIRSKMRSTLLDSQSARVTRIGLPYAMTDANGNPRWLVCVEVNAKNVYGGYVGTRRIAYLFSGNQVWGPNEYINGSPIYSGTCDGRFKIYYEPFSL